MTSPLTPADCDLTDFAFMPLDVRRLLGSRLWLRASHDPIAGMAAIYLMGESWHQIPAASLPNDDRTLAALAGVHWRTWRRIKDLVLSEWVLCDDGRLYLPHLAERALSAWAAKQARMRKVIRRLEIESGEWEALRAAVFARDVYTCRYCGAHGVRLEADHVVPVRLGGASTLENLVTACKPCNRSKGAKPLLVWRSVA